MLCLCPIPPGQDPEAEVGMVHLGATAWGWGGSALGAPNRSGVLLGPDPAGMEVWWWGGQRRELSSMGGRKKWQEQDSGTGRQGLLC